MLPIRLYQFVGSPLKNALLGSAARCRFEPTCSSYAIQAIRRFGCFRGSWLALRRVCRCHPWGGCGYDPVPSDPSRSAQAEPPPSHPTRNPRAFVLASSCALSLI